MKTYAYIANGVVWQIVTPAVYEVPDPAREADMDSASWAALTERVGQEIPLAERFHEDFCAACVDITDMNPAPVENQPASFKDGVCTFGEVNQ